MSYSEQDQIVKFEDDLQRDHVCIENGSDNGIIRYDFNWERQRLLDELTSIPYVLLLPQSADQARTSC